MKLQFEANPPTTTFGSRQDLQLDAIHAVVEIFAGQPAGR